MDVKKVVRRSRGGGKNLGPGEGQMALRMYRLMDVLIIIRDTWKETRRLQLIDCMGML